MIYFGSESIHKLSKSHAQRSSIPMFIKALPLHVPANPQLHKTDRLAVRSDAVAAAVRPASGCARTQTARCRFPAAVHSRYAFMPNRVQAILAAELNQMANGFILRHIFGRFRNQLIAPLIQVGADAERSHHGAVEAVFQGDLSAIHPVGDSVTQQVIIRGAYVYEALLNAEAVKGIGVITWPGLVGIPEDAKIDARSASGAGFKRHMRNLRRSSAQISYRLCTWRIQISFWR